MNIFDKIYYFIFPECRAVSDCNLRQQCNCGKCEDVAISKVKLVLTAEGIKECNYDLCDINKVVEEIEVKDYILEDGKYRSRRNRALPIPDYRSDNIIIKEAKDLYPLLSKS